jgi:hypothetical protein
MELRHAGTVALDTSNHAALGDWPENLLPPRWVHIRPGTGNPGPCQPRIRGERFDFPVQ